MFGSWEEIHPASLGTGSQELQFWAREKSEDTGEKLHPASFRASAITGQNRLQQDRQQEQKKCAISVIRENLLTWESHAGRSWHEIHENPPLPLRALRKVAFCATYPDSAVRLLQLSYYTSAYVLLCLDLSLLVCGRPDKGKD